MHGLRKVILLNKKITYIFRSTFLFMHTLSAESFQGKSNSNMKKPQMLPPHQTKNLHHSCLLLLLQRGEVLFHSCGC